MKSLVLSIFLIARLSGYPVEEEIGGHFEGDMVLDATSLANLLMTSRAVTTAQRLRWPKNQHGIAVVPYTIQNGSPFTSEDINRIRTAMNAIEEVSCVSFVERQFETDYVEIFSGNGCFSNVGRTRGRQVLSLMKPGCLRSGTIIHEIFHTLGFYHTQSSNDRDNYVKINFDNIIKGKEHNFMKYSSSSISHLGTSYDLDSVMHYGGRAFSKNGQDTIQTLNVNDQKRIGQRLQMSVNDIKRLKKMYCDDGLSKRWG